MWGHGGAYADWAEFFQRWGDREVTVEAAPRALTPEDFAPETWNRLVARLQDAVQARLDAWTASLVSDLGAAADPFSIGRALTRARQGLTAVLTITTTPSLPGDLRDQLRDQLVGQVRSLQLQLEERAEQARRTAFDPSREALLRALRENPLTAVLDGASGAEDLTPDPWATLAAAPVRRRVVLD